MIKQPAIYRIRHIESGKSYIGSAVHYPTRWTNHKHELRNNRHHSIKLQNAWNKYGEDAFAFEVVEYVDRIEDLLSFEQTWLTAENVFVRGYNMTPDARSGFGRNHSAETKEKLRAIFLTPEKQQFMSQLHSGKIVSAETRALQSAAKLGKKQSAENIAKRRVKMKQFWAAKKAALLC